MVYSIEKITTLIGARRYGEKDSNIAFLLTDSRSLSFPEETLFFALQSERNDGHNYIEDLHRRGVRNFVVGNSYPIPTDEEWADTNFLAVPSTLAALQRLAERHRDEFDIPIVGITGNAGQSNYASAKAGIIGMTKSIAKELGARNVTVNAIAPGFIKTDMTDGMPEKAREATLAAIPLKRAGEVTDIANTVAFLASDEASYITGEVIKVDGGLAI